MSLFQSARDADVGDSRDVQDMWFGSFFYEGTDDAENGDTVSWSLFRAVETVDSSDQGLWPLPTAIRLARDTFFTPLKDEAGFDGSDEFGGDYEGDFVECP